MVNPPLMSELRAPRTASYNNVSVNKVFDELFLSTKLFQQHIDVLINNFLRAIAFAPLYAVASALRVQALTRRFR